ncbi:MAG: FdhE protein [Firmicutes bacterium]|nr:FdhE protein [Bacillota bacterium]
MDLISFGNKYPFLQANLDFWGKYLTARDNVWGLLPSILDETVLEQSDFLAHLADGKPFLAYESIRIPQEGMEKLAEAFCTPFGLALPQTVFPEEIPLFEKLTVSPDETGFVIAELHSLIAAYIESVITSDEEEAINWLELDCPICGAGAAMGFLAPSGKKNLVCSHCQTVWVYPRINCGLCGHIEERGAIFYTAEEEPNWLVETCKECKSYLKVYDMRNALPDILTYPLHYLTSWNLDLTMRDKEFAPRFFHVFERAGWIKAKN